MIESKTDIELVVDPHRVEKQLFTKWEDIEDLASWSDPPQTSLMKQDGQW